MDKIIVFLSLRILVLLSCFFAGTQIRRKKKFSPIILLPIIVFTLNEGLRFGRGIDYNGYYFKYQDILKYGFSEPKEFLFILFCKINDFFSFPYQGIIIAMSGILIISAVYFLKDHKTVFPFSLSLFTLFSLDAENLIRWFLAFSFLLIGISLLQNNQQKKFFLLAIIAGLFHAGILLLVPLFYLLSFTKKPLLPLYASLTIYLILFFLFKTEYMLFISKYVQLISFGSEQQFAGYIANSEEWLTGTANYIATGLNLGIVINDLIIIWLGYKVTSRRQELTYIFNLYLVGVILSPALYQIEILMRLDMILKIFQFLILGYIINDYMIIPRRRYKIEFIASIIICINIIRIYIINPIFSEDLDSLLYIWDSMGRKVLS